MTNLRFHNLNEMLSRSASRFGPRNAIGTKGASGYEWVTYAQLEAMIGHARGGLASLGVKKGDRVAIVSDNSVAWAVLAFASYSLGAVFVPMYQAQLRSEWEFILKDSGAVIAIGATDEITRSLEEIATRLDTLRHVVGSSLPQEDERSYARLLSGGAGSATEVAAVEPDDLACLIYTSGTTGDPKGVCLSHFNICSNVDGALDRFDFIEGDVSLAFLPWAHIFGQTCELYSILAAGAAMALNDEIPRLVDNLALVRPTVLVAVPRVFNRIYDGVNKQMARKPTIVQNIFSRSVRIATKRSNQGRLGRRERLLLALGDKLLFSKVRQRFGGRLRFVVSGSAALSPVVAEFIDALGIDVFEGYGLTETSPVVSANYPGQRKIGTVGRPFPGVEITIDTSVTGDPEHGEIIVRGPGVMKGYFNRPEETARVLSKDGAFRTGDMGVIDAEGFLKITGRIKEQYKLENGKYVVPSPLEEALKLSPYVANVMIYGANKAHNVALVVVDEQAIRTWMDEHGISGDPLQSSEVKRLVLAEVGEHSIEFKGYERIKNVALISEDFTTENGMLTPKMSLKRRNVLAKYGRLLETLYD